MNRCTTFAICCISKTHRKHTQTRQWKKEQSLHKAENNVLQYLTRLGRPVAHRVAKPRSHSSNLLGEQEEDTRFASAARGCQRTTADGFSEGWSEDFAKCGQKTAEHQEDKGRTQGSPGHPQRQEPKTGFASMAKQLEDQKRTQG